MQEVSQNPTNEGVGGNQTDPSHFGDNATNHNIDIQEEEGKQLELHSI